MTESGRLCAFITKVKRGSLADTVGHLRPGEHICSDLTIKHILSHFQTVEDMKAMKLCKVKVLPNYEILYMSKEVMIKVFSFKSKFTQK